MIYEWVCNLVSFKMRSVVLSNRIRCLNSVSFSMKFVGRIASIGLVGTILASCSSDVTRFDRQLYAALPKAQPTAYEQAVAANQAYPGDVDRTTTASVSPTGVPKPMSTVSPVTTPDHSAYSVSNAQPVSSIQPVYNTPQPTYNQPVSGVRKPLNSALPQPSAYKPAPAYNSGIVKSALPKPSLPKPTIAKPKIAAPQIAKPALPKPSLPKPTQVAAPSIAAAKPVVTDKVQTNSVQSSQNAIAKPVPNSVAPVAGAVNGGWSPVGGTMINLRSGETLYNISKRYGVPVNEIVKANNIKSAADLKVGQQILIPTYVFSKNAPVSAPGADADTRAARSSIGLLGQPMDGIAITPTRRPEYHAALSTDQKEEGLKSRYKPKRSAAEPEGQANPPDYSIVTGSVSKPLQSSPTIGGQYIVKSGDNLGRIAKAHGVSVSALQAANGMSGTMIRLGQKLSIPSGNVIKTSSVKSIPPGVDPIVTGSAKKVETKIVAPAPKPYVKPVVDTKISTSSVNTEAPKSTGIDSLRWPVKGRVVSSFGAKKGSGLNDGIDISVPEGTAVKAAENGVVIYSGSELAGFGNLILVRHADGIVTAYAHNKSNSVSKGSAVKRGQVIATSGRTGDTDTPKLHFEVRKNSKPVNPLHYLGG